MPSRPVEQAPPPNVEQLYSTVERPSNRKENEAPLLMNDPFADLKKNINEMHQQQQKQQQFGYFPGQQNGIHQQQQQQSNPFAMQQSQNPYQQPIIPPRPTVSAGPNPFATATPTSTPSAATRQDEFGWTVTKPVAAPRKAPTPVAPAGGQSDPFAFLDTQTGGDGVGFAKDVPQPMNGFATQFGSNATAVPSTGNASNNILDFLG